jgi:hypothetical protein
MKSRPNLRRFREDLDRATEDSFRTAAALNNYKQTNDPLNPYRKQRLEDDYRHASAYESGLTQALYLLKGEEECANIYDPIYEKHQQLFNNGDYDPKENE